MSSGNVEVEIVVRGGDNPGRTEDTGLCTVHISVACADQFDTS